MYRTLLTFALAVFAISIPAAATGSPNVTLTGVVGPGFNISLKNPDGSRVNHLDVGTYDISVTDNEITHNFHLRGPGVEQSTDIEGTATVTWTVQITDGTYTFMCDAHPVQMKGTFTAGSVQPPPPTPVVPKLSGKVTAKAISLKTAAGARVKSIAQNRYKLTVSDSSNKQNFHLTGPGVNKKTGLAAKSRATWTLTLKPGKYTYLSDKNRKLRGTFKVTSTPGG
jgi:hypothetical protein